MSDPSLSGRRWVSNPFILRRKHPLKNSMADTTPECRVGTISLEVSVSSIKEGERFNGHCSHILMAAIKLLFSTLSGQQIKISVQCTVDGGIKLYILRQAGKDGQREPGMKLNTIGKNCESKHMDVKGRVSTFT